MSLRAPVQWSQDKGAVVPTIVDTQNTEQASKTQASGNHGIRTPRLSGQGAVPGRSTHLSALGRHRSVHRLLANQLEGTGPALLVRRVGEDDGIPIRLRLIKLDMVCDFDQSCWVSKYTVMMSGTG